MKYELPKALGVAAKELCRVILVNAGGASAIANSLKWDRQYIHICMTTGSVPLERAYEVSQLLKVSPWAISYLRLAKVFGDDRPKFKTIVNQSPILPAQKTEILNLLP